MKNEFGMCFFGYECVAHFVLADKNKSMTNDKNKKTNGMNENKKCAKIK